MDLYIKWADNRSYDHPILKENLIAAFPDFDEVHNSYNYVKYDNTNDGQPTVDEFEVLEGSHYTIDENKVVTRVWDIREMTQEEAVDKRDELLRKCVADGTFILNSLETLRRLNSKSQEQIETFRAQVENLVNNPVPFPKYCCSGCMAEDTGRQLPDRYNWD